jgi:hypothetical protein
MIRIVNPLHHTKYLDTSRLRSVFLWWSDIKYTDKYNTFLQFGTWSLNDVGATTTYNTIWKYTCFHTARSDMSTILQHACHIQSPHILRYTDPVISSAQLIGETLPSSRAAFAALNGLLPKKPL